MEKVRGSLPIFISKKLEYLSKKMADEFDRGDVDSAMRTRWIYDCIFCGWFYRRKRDA